MIDYYKRKVAELKLKVKAYAEMGDAKSAGELEKEVANYEKHIRQNEPKGVDSYLS